MLAQRLAEGFTAEVYAWGTDKVLKLFKKDFPEKSIYYEAQISRAVEKTGLAPEVGEIIKLDGRTGIVYERISGMSMLEQLKQTPEKLEELAQLFADLQTRIHQISRVPDIPMQLERLKHKINRVAILSSNERQRLLDLIEKLPLRHQLCHGDFHPGNIMLSEKGAKVIDWMDAALGDPVADVARTLLILKGVAVWSDKPMQDIVVRFTERYRQYYLARNVVDSDTLNAWYAVMAAGRLSESLNTLESWLVNEVRAGLEKM